MDQPVIQQGRLPPGLARALDLERLGWMEAVIAEHSGQGNAHIGQDSEPDRSCEPGQDNQAGAKKGTSDGQTKEDRDERARVILESTVATQGVQLLAESLLLDPIYLSSLVMDMEGIRFSLDGSRVAAALHRWTELPGCQGYGVEDLVEREFEEVRAEVVDRAMRLAQELLERPEGPGLPVGACFNLAPLATTPPVGRAGILLLERMVLWQLGGRGVVALDSQKMAISKMVLRFAEDEGDATWQRLGRGAEMVREAIVPPLRSLVERIRPALDSALRRDPIVTSAASLADLRHEGEPGVSKEQTTALVARLNAEPWPKEATAVAVTVDVDDLVRTLTHALTQDREDVEFPNTHAVSIACLGYRQPFSGGVPQFGFALLFDTIVAWREAVRQDLVPFDAFVVLVAVLVMVQASPSPELWLIAGQFLVAEMAEGWTIAPESKRASLAMGLISSLNAVVISLTVAVEPEIRAGGDEELATWTRELGSGWQDCSSGKVFPKPADLTKAFLPDVGQMTVVTALPRTWTGQWEEMKKLSSYDEIHPGLTDLTRLTCHPRLKLLFGAVSAVGFAEDKKSVV